MYVVWFSVLGSLFVLVAWCFWCFGLWCDCVCDCCFFVVVRIGLLFVVALFAGCIV